jgi:L-ascorbate metabolism protein UlaG (beta-lactamase superfamily)
MAPRWADADATHVRVTWYGHATALIHDEARVLTDPVLTGSLVHLRRRAGLSPGRLAHEVDAVVISHLHSDHLHLPSLALLPPGTPVLLPRGAARLLRRLPVRPVEVTAGDVVPVGSATVTVVHADHDAARWPGGRTRGDAVGYVVCGRGATYFAGDTLPFPAMSSLHPALDVALLPVGGWGPWLRGAHLTPRTAAGCLPLLGARVSVPIHYGTFWPRGLEGVRPRVFHDPGREFAEHARDVAPDVDVRVLHPGSSTAVAL